jgi:hypothetical protein
VPINTSGAAGSALAVYGSWVTDVSPDALPENVSPDNQEVVYGPGSVGSRPAFQVVSGIQCPPIGGVTPDWVYSKSYTTPTGVIKNLWADSAGRLFVEDFSNHPGTITLLVQSTPGSFWRSITQFGREYIAPSDGLHGSDSPMQYDGTFLDRVTMNGPGAPPTVTSLALPSSLLQSGGNTLTRNNNQVTAITATATGLQVGYQVQISNVPDSNSTTVVQTKTAGGIAASGAWQFVDNAYRSAFNPGTSPLSGFVASGFGLNIPSTATVLGVVISFQAFAQASTTGTVASVALWYTGSQEGTAKTPGTALTVTPTLESYGSAADLWSASLTPTIVNDPTFGFAVSITADTIRAFLHAPFTIQVYYTLSGPGTVAIVDTIVIDNETHPGLALVTTTEPHGLAPGENVSIVGVEPAVVSTVAAAEWSSGVTTLTTTDNHNLTPGGVVQVAGVTTSTATTTFSFNGTFTIEKVPSPNQLVWYQSPITATDPDLIDATASTGNITISWPIPDDTPTPTYFEVDSAPTPTTFYIPVSYSDGTWTTGTVGFIWEGIFYVTSIISPTEFTYFQEGPNGATSAIGTVTPYGQAAPGLHLCQVLWLTRQGAIPAPSPPMQFVASGGQYVNVTNIPIGPANVIGRILAFTGAQPDVPGELPPFYYIPTPAQLEGQIVSTATQINDNTTTSVVLDFSDNTLFAAIGISIPGNNLASQIVLDGALGFRTYLSRLETFGQRNVIQNLLNLGFEGGYLTAPINPMQFPLGWTVNQVGGTLVNAHLGTAWQTSIVSIGGLASSISQSAYLDAYGVPIFVGNQTYLVRFWAVTNGATFTQAPQVNIILSSASTGFTSTATVTLTNTTAPAWYQANFNTILPTDIPADLLFTVNVGGTSLTGLTVTIDDIQPIFAQTPYLDNQSFASYVSNPEGMDGVSGKWGPDDTAKIMDMAVVRGTQYILTQAPAGKLHETTGSAVTEPSGWEVDPIAGECGLLSAFGLTVSQADDATEAGGGQWMAWASDVGAMIFGGGLPEKISQEIQPNWFDPTRANTGVQINMAAATTVWALNDPVSRLLMFGLPIGTATKPSQIYVLDYQHLGSAAAIADSPPFHPSFAGKLIATDNSRKWTHWIRPMNSAARIYRSAGKLTNVFLGAGFGNAYTLNPSMFTDDNYGLIGPYYITYAFLDPQTQQALQLKPGRVLLAFVLAQVQSQGNTNSQVTLTYYPDNLANPWPLTTTRTLTPNFYKDRNFGGGMAQGDRIFIKIASSPITGTDNSFLLTRFEAFFRNSRILVTGVNQ